MPAPPPLDVRPLARLSACAVVGLSRGGAREVVPVGTASPGTAFRIASLTKPLTALATVLAAQRQGVGLDVPAIEVLPDLRDDWVADRRLTAAHVLSQTSGLAPAVTADEVARLGGGSDAPGEAARLVVRAGSVRAPGATWEYYNGNYFLAGAVAAALGGADFEEVLADLVLRPWGLAATSFVAPSALAQGVESGRPLLDAAYPRARRPSGGLCSTVPDLLGLGEQLLARADLLHTLAAVRTTPADPVPYGLGWALGPSGQMYLDGRLAGYRAALLLVPDHAVAAVCLAAGPDTLPAVATVLSGLQRGLTGDELAGAIDGFAA